MIKQIKSDQRHFNDFGWLKTHWLFSFANYFDPDNIQFGALRVFNDDVVLPGKGFPTHPHREMEIVTIALEGEITHKDSMGNEAVIRAGEVQRMSAGTGLTHSEYNLSQTKTHFYQIWIYPDTPGLKPSYDQKTFTPTELKNKLVAVASGQNIPGAVTIHTDATIYRADLDKGKNISFTAGETRRIFVYVGSGKVEINGRTFSANDQARIDLENKIDIKSVDDSSLILIDVPSCKGWGYDEKTLKGS